MKLCKESMLGTKTRIDLICVGMFLHHVELAEVK